MDVEVDFTQIEGYENVNPYGVLLDPEAQIIYKQYFNELVQMLGITVAYFEPKDDKHYTQQGEIKSNYKSPIWVGCIFNDHPDQQTMKRMKWVAELQPDASIIHVPYDLSGLQVGALFAIPSGINPSVGRVFRVSTISNIMIYPASVACEIVPEYKNTIPEGKEKQKTKGDMTHLVVNDPKIIIP